MTHYGPIGPYRERKMDKPTNRPPFRCGFQPEGKPYRAYWFHIQGCQHHDCKGRWENNQALTREILANHGVKIVTNEHQATSAAFSGAAFPNASTSTGSHRHPTRSH